MKFIDLFAGIGGFHFALSKLGMECVFASEMDSSARETYIKNHSINENIFNNDIRNISPEMIPDHDILCAGFPCQPFSQAGHKRGFDDVHDSERGNLFYYIADILEQKRPRAFILENVRHLLKHDDGKTFATIKKILEDLDYTIYYQIIKASDFGRPQHRPRIYIVGFNNQLVNTLFSYKFPQPIGCSMTMSDIFEGQCSRDIGLTLRVGGRGSPIDDRRNWDGYIVDGKETRLGPKEGRRMMGYPDDFYLPKSITQAMKQLGNSVCVDVVYHVAQSIQQYLTQFTKETEVIMAKKQTLNKGEWSELYAFLKAIRNPNIFFGDIKLQQLNPNEYITVFQMRHNDSDRIYLITGNQLCIKSPNEPDMFFTIDEILNDENIKDIFDSIQSSTEKTFEFINPQLLDSLSITDFKGRSISKPDVNVGFTYQNFRCNDDPLGIKSFIGSAPTLLNAGTTTNFIFSVNGFDGTIDEVNDIQTSKKIKERLEYIQSKGGKLKFDRCQNSIFEQNLSIVDGDMLSIISDILLAYYSGEGAKLSDLVTDTTKIIKVKRFLNTILLGMFPGTLWDGKKTANGMIVVDKVGELYIYHVIKEDILNDYLFNNTKLDTASSSRHEFGLLYEENGKMYFKLNLQIRNC